MPPSDMKRSWGEAQKRRCAAGAGWKCGLCTELLPATFEVDHIIPLHMGGADDIDTNAMALCPNCHRAKSQKERIHLMEVQRAERHAHAQSARLEWEGEVRVRERAKIKITTVGPGVSRCSECKSKFYDVFTHPKCPVVEAHINAILSGTNTSRDVPITRYREMYREMYQSPPAGPADAAVKNNENNVFERFRYESI